MRDRVMECASPLALSNTHNDKSGGGPPHSKTCRPFSQFMIGNRSGTAIPQA